MSSYILGTHNNGKNFVNLLANILIREIEKETKNHKSEIQITNNKNFIVVRGYTTHKQPINLSQLFSKKYNELFGSNQIFNVVDLIEYNTKPNQDFIYINNKFKYDVLEKDLIEKINLDTNKGLDYRFTANTDLSVVLVEGKTPEDELKSYFDNYNHYKVDKSTETFTSDLYFGRNLKSSKLFEFYLKYIAYNIFERNLCKDIELTLFTDAKFEDINWENLKLNVKSNSLITTKEWVESLILDLFTFEPEKIIEKWDLTNYDFENDIISSDDKIWEIRDKVGEMILL